MENAAPQPTDDPVYALLEQARQFILGRVAFIEGAFSRLGDVPLTATLARHLTRHALMPAEAALRRAILIIAASLPVPVLRAVKSRAAPDTARPRAPAASLRPGARPRFNMNEPVPRKPEATALLPKTDYLTEDQLPRILVLTGDILAARSTPPPPAPAPAPKRDPSASFHRRFAALQAALNDPQGEAQRWARRRIREMARPGAVQRPLPVPLALPHLGKDIDSDTRSLLRELTVTTNTSFCHDTS